MSTSDDDLPELSAEAALELAAQLRAAWAPDDLEAEVDDELIAAALEPATDLDLGAAWSPGALEPAVHERLLAAALAVQPEDVADPEEQHQASLLREALDGRGSHPYLALAETLRAASAPTPPGREAVRALAEAALARPRRGNVFYATFGAATAILAVAAAFALALRPSGDRSGGAPYASAPNSSRTTSALFEERFETPQTTARVDRIHSARERDLRDNRFAAWGLR